MSYFFIDRHLDLLYTFGSTIELSQRELISLKRKEDET
jgi:hypothetical protein